MKPRAIIFVMLAALVFLLAAPACGSTDSGSMAGNWHLEIDRSALPSMTDREMSSAESVIKSMKFDMTLNSDGTGSAVGNISGQTKEIRFRWTETESTLSLSSPDSVSSKESIVFTKKNGRLYFPVSLMGKEQVNYCYLTR